MRVGSTEHDNLLHHVVGAILRELEVCGSITLIVSVATDSYVDVGIGLYNIAMFCSCS